VDLQKLSPREAGELISANPRRMYRPILTNGRDLVLGFKPAEMEKLL
jgi:arsenate reductase-like glutaredoxin family protein